MNGERARAYSYVRMSTDMQLKGDSRRRQMQLSADYAKDHNLILVEDFRLEDIGVSAFTGDNVREGEFGRFLNAVKQGLIPQGTYLLVEALDRISRQSILKSLPLFLEIINSGITIVTLRDKRVYRAQAFNIDDLYTSITSLKLAHEESLLKSERGGQAWGENRSLARPVRLR
jgi:DNA invertase Pin-like site-specific DNA recombinase